MSDRFPTKSDSRLWNLEKQADICQLTGAATAPKQVALRKIIIRISNHLAPCFLSAGQTDISRQYPIPLGSKRHRPTLSEHFPFSPALILHSLTLSDDFGGYSFALSFILNYPSCSMASRDQQLWQYTYAVPTKNSCHQLQAHDRSSPKLNYCENPHTVEKFYTQTRLAIKLVIILFDEVNATKAQQ